MLVNANEGQKFILEIERKVSGTPTLKACSL